MAGTVITSNAIHVDTWIPPFVKQSWTEWNASEWQRVDKDDTNNRTIYFKMEHPNDLSMIEAGTIDEIYSCHAMEHLSPTNAYTLLGEFQRVLKAGGTMRHITPDFDSLITLWKEMNSDWQLLPEDDRGPYDYERYITICNGVLCPWDGVMANYPGHKSLWGEDIAKFLLKRWGFVNVKTEVVGTDLHFSASMPEGEYNTIRV
jgi:predicted SAM-dependent methyltransferase